MVSANVRFSTLFSIPALLVLVFALPVQCDGQNGSPWRSWDSQDGFVESYTSSLAVNPSGGIWAKHGVLGRLELLDGYGAPHFADPGASGQIQCAPDGTLWMWSGKGLKRFQSGRWSSFILEDVARSGSLRSNSREGWDFTSYAPPNLQATVAVVALSESRVLISLPDRILEFDASHASTRVVLGLAEAGLRRFTTIRKAGDGNIYVTGLGGIGRLERTAGDSGWQWRALPRPPAKYLDFDAPIAVRPDELYVAGIASSLTADALRFDGVRWQALYGGHSRNVKAWPGSDSSVWIQDGNHIVELTAGGVKPVERSGALSGVLLDVMPEAPGRFWVASSEGLSRYTPSLWRTPPEAPVLDDVVNAITEDKSGNLWFLAAGELICYDNKTWSTYPLPKGETPWAIFTEGLAVLEDGRIAIETQSPHLLIFDPVHHDFQTVKHPGGRGTRLFVRRPDGTLLVEIYPPGSKEVEIESFDGREFRPFLEKEKLGGISDLRSIVADPDGQVWVGATTSFAVLGASGLRAIGAAQGFLDPGAYYIFRDASGRLFAGGRDGFYRRDGTRWIRIQQGLDRVRSVIEARDGGMWIATGSGVHRYRNGIWISHGVEEGLPSNVAYKVFEDSRGRLWAGTSRGLSQFHPEADADPPLVTLADGQNLAEAPPTGQVRLAFSGIDKWKFTPRSRLLFSFRMDGGPWSPFASGDSASFDKLPGGRHRFEVRAMDRNGNIGPSPAVHLFSVLLPWYRTPGFLISAFLAAALMALLLVLAYVSYAHRGSLIASLNQKNQLERERQNILEKIARREPLPEILEMITESLARHCPGAVSLLAWDSCDGLSIYSLPPLSADVRAAIGQTRIPSGANLSWWRLICFAGGRPDCRDDSPVSAIYSGDREILGAITLLLPSHSPIPEPAQWLTETFAGLSAAAIENARLYERLAHQAQHDVLTGLPNRLCFDEKLHTCVEAARATVQPLALLYLDLDRFKQINDTLGHRIGDLFLREVSRRFSGALHKGATLARIGGDEFTVLLEYGVDKTSAGQLATKMLTALQSPICIEGQELFASASIGISLFPQDGATPSTLQKNADIAMYRAKSRGKNRMEFFSAEMGSKTAAAIGMEQLLRKALDEKGFELFYQPQFTPWGDVRGMEALVRMRCQGGGHMGAGEFAPVAEESGLILPIGAWVLREACRQFRQWIDEGLAVEKIAVNVSALEMGQESFARHVAAVLSEMRLQPAFLELEFTESALVRNPAESAAQLNKLRALGVRLAIDDYRAAYPSFSHLETLPLDTIKIDRSLTAELSRVGRSPLIEATVALGKARGLSVAATGVETAEQWRAIRESGCDFVQGFLLSRPLPAPEARQLLEREIVIPELEEIGRPTAAA